ncbi:MAG: DUF3597 domain-containing protein [Sphingomonas bacterium]|nr:DUF3597 domain-containing protein [Sphingomonas bacterium]
MSIFSKIKDAIFGKKAAPAAEDRPQIPAGMAGGAPGARPAPPRGSRPPGRGAPPPADWGAAGPPPHAPPRPGAGGGGGGGARARAPTVDSGPVDVVQSLDDMAAAKGNPDLNYKSSIVDLMKLLGLDSSLDDRKELADELGYTGDKDGSAEMNIWLHKEVMRQLAANGGKVPASMTD